MALVEHGTFGGTCLNVGCIPTKMFVHPADLARAVRPGRPSRGSTRPSTRCAGPTSATACSAGSTRSRTAGRDYRAAPVPQHHALRGPRPVHRPAASCTSRAGRDAHRRPDRDRRRQPARSSRAVVAESGVPFHTSDTVMRIDDAARAPGHPRVGLHRRGVRARLLRVRQRGVGGRPQQPDAARAGRDRVRAVHRAGPATAGTCTWAPSRCGSARRRRRGRARPGRRDGRARRPAARRHGPDARTATCSTCRPAAIPTHPDGRVVVDEYQRTPGRRRVRARRRQLAVPAQARREPRVEGRGAQPAAPRRAAAHRPPVRAVGGVHRAADRRGRAHRAGLPGRAASTTRCTCRPTATSRTGGRWRTTPASARCWPSAAPGGCWARTSWGRRRRW